MSSSGRYQSRLFNFASQQSRRFVDQRDRTFRHVKVAAAWGVQVLLYPIYLIFQATRLLGQQLQQAVQQQLPQLQTATKAQEHSDQQALTADTAIQRVLETAQSFLPPLADQLQSTPSLLTGSTEDQAAIAADLTLSGDELTSASNLSQNSAGLAASQRPVIQGVATLLATRSLVLVTVQNQILDVLTLEQQQQLCQRLSWEIASYWRQLRLAQAHQPKLSAPLRLPKDQPKALAPVRMFWQLMAWVQTGPVAIAANLFQESSLSLPPRANPAELKLPGVPQLVPYETLVFLDRTVADLEQRTWWRNHQPHHLATTTKPTPTRLNRPGWLQWVQGNQSVSASTSVADAAGGTTATTETAATRTLRMQSLIRAAIAYFFGNRGQKLSEPTADLPFEQFPPGASTSLPTRKLPWQNFRTETPLLDSSEADPWLTPSDLFGDPEASWDTVDVPPTGLSGPGVALPPSAQGNLVPGNPLKNLVQRYFKSIQTLLKPESQSELVLRQRTLSRLARLRQPSSQSPQTSDRPGQLLGNSESLEAIASTAATPLAAQVQPLSTATIASTSLNAPVPEAQGSHLDPAPNWIETEATLMGYVKHPLEQLLEWLDRGMLWLEEHIVIIWRWLQQFWQQK